jgi:hypothetical protein
LGIFLRRIMTDKMFDRFILFINWFKKRR